MGRSEVSFTAVGQTYGDYRITKYLPVQELQSSLLELIHEPSGARIMHIANDDSENLFCLSLQTLPDSSNGVAHILEHVVLCGSKKYPVRDPFFAMRRRSLHTFMNAMTGQDFTCYPASSQVEKDFYNILDVYLDAVFCPQLKKVSFLQEGHRFEFKDPKNYNSPLQIRGIVYNEMKGAMSSPDSRLWEAVSKHLLPDLPYAHNSGGDPMAIVKLTHEELLAFHRMFYQPSRCIFFFYGNLPLAKHLDFIQQRTLCHASKVSPLPPLPLQPRFTSPIRAVNYYPIHKGENPEGKTKIAFCWLTVALVHQSEVLSLCLIESLLMETDASPLKRALLKSGLCTDVDSSLDIEMSEVPFSIVCNGCLETNEEKLQKLLFSSIEEICSRPIDPELIEAALHQLEFQRTEIGSEGGPFGLTLFMRAALIKQHGSEPENGLFIHQLFRELRDRLQDPAYLPNLMRKLLLENTHFLTQLLIADPHLEEKEYAIEESRLQQIVASMSVQDKMHLISQSEELAKYQETSEQQPLDCLPTIALQDISPIPRSFDLAHTSFSNFDVYRHECFTNQIVYADVLFDLPHLDVDELSLVSLLVRLWTELGCAGKSYEQALHAMQAHTGGIDAHLALHVSAVDPSILKPAFSLRGKALFRNAEFLFQYLQEYASSPNFSDRTRIQEWLQQHLSALEDDLPSHAIQYATQLSLSGYCPASFIYNQWNGLAYHQFVKRLAKDSKATWIDRLPELAKRLISTGKPHLVLSCGAKEAESLLAHQFYQFGSWVSTSTAKPWDGNYSVPPVSSQARAIAAPVAFTVLGMHTSTYRDPGVAELMISTQLLEHLVLHREIREKGGAYGTTAFYAPTTGNYYLYAYRDPHLAKTIDTFYRAIHIIGSGRFNERELEEAKISLIGTLDTPITPGNRGLVAYAWLRSGRTLEERAHLRRQILSLTKEEVMRVVQQKLSAAPSTIISLLGSDLYHKEAPDLKQPLPLKELFS